jgi:hypothetical protein
MRKPPRFHTHNGETLSIAEWARRLGIPATTIEGRIRRGHPINVLQRVRHKAKVERSTDGRKATEHPLYKNWQQMRERCYNPKIEAFKRYGARGVKVCDRWNESFWAFIEDVGERPSPSHTIDRIDNDKGYGPDNFRWATKREQNLNTRRNRIVEWDGELMPTAVLAERLGFTFHEVWGRVYHLKGDMVKVRASLEKLRAKKAAGA